MEQLVRNYKYDKVRYCVCVCTERKATHNRVLWKDYDRVCVCGDGWMFVSFLRLICVGGRGCLITTPPPLLSHYRIMRKMKTASTFPSLLFCHTQFTVVEEVCANSFVRKKQKIQQTRFVDCFFFNYLFP